MIRIHLNSAGSDQSVGVKSVYDRGPPARPFHINKNEAYCNAGARGTCTIYHLTCGLRVQLCAYPNGLCVLTSTAQNREFIIAPVPVHTLMPDCGLCAA